MADSFAKRKRMSYTAAFKLNVIDFAANNNNCAASRQFGVSEKLVRDWRKKKEELKNMPKSKKAMRHGKAVFPELETKLNDWIVDRRLSGYTVTRTEIRFRALKLAKELLIATKPNGEVFRASVGWCNRFMNRYGLCIRQRTKIAQKLPIDLEDKILQFQKYVIDIRKRMNIELSQIGNMDEVPMTFDMPANKTVARKGEKTIMVKTSGHEKTHFSVVLACLADGSKLPPVIIFKRKTLPKGSIFPPGVIVRAQEKGWMNEAGMIEWLEKVWNRRPGALLKKPSLLVWDSFRAHKCEDVMNKAKELKTTVAVIPGGLTSILQLLDVCLNKPFKGIVRKYWADWISSDLPVLTKGGNLRKPDIVLVAQWIKNAWDEIPSPMIIKLFTKCSISNSLDGTEDDRLFESDDDVDDDDDSDSEIENIYDDVPMTEKEFCELFGHSDSESDFEGF